MCTRPSLRLFILLGTLMISASASAQVPQMFSYQGVLANSDGTALPDGAHTLVVRLYDSPADGSALWEESHDLNTVSGVFSVILGSKEEFGLVFDRPYFLGVSLDGADEEAARIPLTASPYSLGTRTAVAEPESGESFAVRNEDGDTAHILSADGSVTHSGLGTFGGGIVVPSADSAAGKSGANSGPLLGGNFRGLEIGLMGSSLVGKGVQGIAAHGIGVAGVSETGTAVQGTTVSGTAIVGSSDGGDAIIGLANDGSGVIGRAVEGIGVVGQSDRNVAVQGQSSSGVGISGVSVDATGVVGNSENSNGGFFLGRTGVRVAPHSVEDGPAGLFLGDVLVVNNQEAGRESRLIIPDVKEDPEEDKLLVWDDDNGGIVRFRTFTPGGGGDGAGWILSDGAVTTNNDVRVKSGIFTVTDEEVNLHNGIFTVSPDGESAAGKSAAAEAGALAGEHVVVNGTTRMDGSSDFGTTLAVVKNDGLALDVTGTTRMDAGDQAGAALFVAKSSGLALDVAGPSAIDGGQDASPALRVGKDGGTAVEAVAVGGDAIRAEAPTAARLIGDVSVENRGLQTAIVQIETLEEELEPTKLVTWDDDGSTGVVGALRYTTFIGGWNDDGAQTTTERNVVISGGSLSVNSSGGSDVVTIDPSSGTNLEVKGHTALSSNDDVFATLEVENTGLGNAITATSSGIGIRATGGDAAAQLFGDVMINDFESKSTLSIQTVTEDPDEEKFLVWDADGTAGFPGAVRYRSLPDGSTCVKCDENGASLEGALKFTSGGTATVTIDPASGTKTVEINNQSSNLGLGINAGLLGLSAVSFASGGTGVQGVALNGGVGVRGVASGDGSVAGDFQGDVSITGNAFVSEGLSISGEGTSFFGGDVVVVGVISKGGGEFLIDHPLDPENRYLRHSFVESPDMMNVYNGNVVLDADGEAWIELPEWFETLNKDFRYQLTCIGGFAQVFVADEIRDNRFRIAGGTDGLKVSWQVTGVRDDPWARLNRIPVEEAKPPEKRGTLLHPEAYGAMTSTR